MKLNHDFVMTCNADMLKLLAVAVGITLAQANVTKPKKLRSMIGTKLTNSVTYGAEYTDGTLDFARLCDSALNSAIEQLERDLAQAQADNEQRKADADAQAQADADAKRNADAQAQADASNSAYNEFGAFDASAQNAQQSAKQANSAVKSAKAWLRELLSADGAQYTIKQLCALTGKTEVNIRTMLSDLRSIKYAGKAGVFNTKSVRVNGETYYSKA
jgi:hypothetical protein